MSVVRGGWSAVELGGRRRRKPLWRCQGCFDGEFLSPSAKRGEDPGNLREFEGKILGLEQGIAPMDNQGNGELLLKKRQGFGFI
jgi:hypothetical protein